MPSSAIDVQNGTVANYEITEDTPLLASPDGHEEEVQKAPYPKSIFFIIGNEFCERFSYYGMKAILTLYLTTVLLYSDDTATVIYHVFSMACYFTPIFGAIISDSFLGKFKTIFYISIIYALGNIVLAVASVPHFLPMIPLTMVGLALIAIGTGGIKPCVSAFGGDQFGPGQERQLQRFFSLFYLSINAGSLISTFLTPILRADVQCLNQKTCYPLAFGVPAALMVTSLILFILGRPLYKIIAPSGNVVVSVLKCIGHAIANKWKSKSEKKENWLDYADDKYEKKFIQDIKAVLHVLRLYIPLPVFWALFDQQGSRWTLQATRMNGEVGSFRIKPDQMQVINPLLIIGFIPLFEYVVYPLMSKCNFLVKPLQRITVGGVLAASSFIIAAFVQFGLDKTLPVMPEKGFAQVNLIGEVPHCSLHIQGLLKEDIKLEYGDFKTFKSIEAGVEHNLNITVNECSRNTSTTDVNPLSYHLFLNSTDIASLMITMDKNELKILQAPDSLKKPEKGESNVRIFYYLPDFAFTDYPNATFKLVGKSDYELNETMTVLGNEKGTIGATSYIRIDPNKYALYLPINNTAHESTPVGSFEVKSGGGYIITISRLPSSEQTEMKIHTLVPANTFPMLYQIPQYMIITAGEIMFSITGLEFSYSQAPASMKSVLQAAWLLTVAFGNLIVVIVAEAHFFEEQAHEFLMFAGLMIVDMVIFAIMAYYYKYVGEDRSDKNKLVQSKGEDEKNGIYNASFNAEDTTKM